MNNAEQLITNASLKPTAARTAVLSVLLKAQAAISHAEILAQLASTHSHEFDRVTLYRVLEWLTEHALIHRVIGDDRAWKFQISSPQTTHHHAHLHCTQCGKTICLNQIQADLPAEIMTQYQVESVDIHIKGCCESCSASSRP
ncbi:MAG: transcriptional repressor [Methylophilaceae bacterium]|nr:transcriptional repressor [Methylophilaceae bacterium]NOT69693.1 transcriptional repressor [Methylophilaceae bacterium]